MLKVSNLILASSSNFTFNESFLFVDPFLLQRDDLGRPGEEGSAIELVSVMEFFTIVDLGFITSAYSPNSDEFILSV
jgi:hypothetical protein